MQFLRLHPNPHLKDSDLSLERDTEICIFICIVLQSPPKLVNYKDCKDHLGKHFMKHRIEVYTSSFCRRRNRDSEALDTLSSIIQ